MGIPETNRNRKPFSRIRHNKNPYTEWKTNIGDALKKPSQSPVGKIGCGGREG